MEADKPNSFTYIVVIKAYKYYCILGCILNRTSYNILYTPQ
jgi:hypothetical protein